MSDTRHQFKLKDVSEVVIGASVLALPLAITEEAWDLGVSLPLINTILIAVASVVILGLFIHHSFFAGDLQGRGKGFLVRVLSVYGITLLVAAVALLAVDKLPLLTEPLVAIKRVVLVSLPASFSGTVVDSLRD